VNATNVIQVRDTVASNALSPGQSQIINFPDTWVPTVAGNYRHIAVTLLAGDATPSNNEMDLEVQVLDTTLSNIVLSFDNGIASTNGISWQGGGGGIGMHFIPPFYPCYINKMGSYVVDDPNGVGYSMQIYKDDGPNGTPLTQLDSVFVAPGTFTIGQYNEVNTSTSIPVTSEGIYVAWMMGGDGVILGEDGIPPFSFQSYEVLGSASNPNAWAEYRNGELSDPIIHAVISTTPTGINEINSTLNNSFGEFFPNPALSKTKISFELIESSTVTVSIYDINGQLLYANSLGKVTAGKGSFEVDMKGYEAGVYFCKINAGGTEIQRKITLVK
jgi:hypothetical protein